MSIAADVWRRGRLPNLADLDRIGSMIDRLRPLVEAHVTPERVLRYARAVSEMPAPSTTASAMRAPVLHRLLAEDGSFEWPLRLDDDFERTGNTVLICGRGERKPLWYFAHLDTISYLVQPARGGAYPLVPFCYHLTENGSRPAQAMRYDLAKGGFRVCAEGELRSVDGKPYFHPDSGSRGELRTGDRVVPIAPFSVSASGELVGHLDNGGGVAALAVAASVLARTGVDAMIAFPDEEEGPRGSGNQMIARGTARLMADRCPPELAVVVDMQQAIDGDMPGASTAGRLGAGAVLSEFSSLGRGAVTPPPLYALAQETIHRLGASGVCVRESANTYTSRSDDVSIMLKTPAILLLGFPGFDRHFDRAYPRAHLSDLVNLSKALVYMSALATVLAEPATGGSVRHV